MAGNFSRTHNAFALVLNEMTDDEFASSARDYIWLAEYGPTARFQTFQPQRDAVVSECERRGSLTLPPKNPSREFRMKSADCESERITERAP